MAPRGDSCTSVDALLFDMGGVLVEFDFMRAFQDWSRCCGESPEALRSRWRMDEPYRRFERGEIAASDYFAALRESLGISLTDEELSQGWCSIFIGEVPGTAALLRSLSGRLPMYVFSNTNAAHQAVWSKRFAEALKPFDKVFTSSEIGKRKPAPEAFHAVCRAIDVPPERVLFFDDTVENVAGALAIGMQAVHVGSAGDIASALRSRGL